MFQLFKVLLLFNLYHSIQERKRERKKVKFSKKIFKILNKSKYYEYKKKFKMYTNKEYIIKNVSSSTSHKKTPSFRLYVFTSLRLSVFLYENLWANPSPNDFPTLCEQFLACFPLKREGDATVSSYALWLNFWIRRYPYNSHIFRVMILNEIFAYS